MKLTTNISKVLFIRNVWYYNDCGWVVVEDTDLPPGGQYIPSQKPETQLEDYFIRFSHTFEPYGTNYGKIYSSNFNYTNPNFSTIFVDQMLQYPFKPIQPYTSVNPTFSLNYNDDFTYEHFRWKTWKYS